MYLCVPVPMCVHVCECVSVCRYISVCTCMLQGTGAGTELGLGKHWCHISRKGREGQLPCRMKPVQCHFCQEGHRLAQIHNQSQEMQGNY